MGKKSVAGAVPSTAVKGTVTLRAVPSIEDEEAVKGTLCAEEVPSTGVVVPSFDAVPAGLSLRDALYGALDLVDPGISENNPVWHWAYCDDHCTFVFRDGRKVTLPLNFSEW